MVDFRDGIICMSSMRMLEDGDSLIDIAARFGVSLDAARKRKERLEKNPPDSQVGEHA